MRSAVCRMALDTAHGCSKTMPKSKVTAKYQVTIPRDVRVQTGVEAGEIVSVEAVSKSEIRLRRFPGVPEPLKVLVGSGEGRWKVPIEELEEKAESG